MTSRHQRTSILTRAAHEDDGVALFYALLVVIVVGAVVAVVFATSFSQQRQAAFELDFEDTIHTAEAGVEVTLQELKASSDYTTTDSGGSEVSGPAPGQDRYDWALAAATAGGANELPAIDTGEGEFVAIRPSGSDTEWVYGVGFTPSRDAFVNDIGENFARVVRTQVAFDPSEVVGDFALLAGGNTTLSGNFKVEGSNGSVHSNGALAVNGSGTVDQTITHSGTCTKGCSRPEVIGPVDPVPIDPVDPLNVWGSDDAITIATQGDWYDYCSGSWRLRGPGDAAPCDGTPTATPDGWAGTTYNNPATPSNSVFFFANDEDVDMKKMDGNLTVITGGNIDLGPSGPQPPFDARYPGLLFLAGGDIEFTGNTAVFAPENPAVVFANGSLELGGTVDFEEIAFVARDEFDAGTSYKGGGGGSITYNGGAVFDDGGDGDPVVLRWEELQD